MTIEWFDGQRAELGELFALADDAPARVREYRDLGRVLVARDGGAVIGHLQILGEARRDAAEVKSLAVLEDRRGTGIGTLLLERAVAVCREEARGELLVATAAADTGALRFYQRFGFRLQRVERDAFTAETGYPGIEVDGIPLRDRVWLSLQVDGHARAVTAGPRPLQLRVARHTERLDELVRFYRDGLGLVEAGRFRGHGGYDGVFLEVPGTRTHLELTTGGDHRAPVAHPESLLVLYLGSDAAVATIASRLDVAPVAPANPYWAEHGVTFEDPDGFRVVLVPEAWEP